jgi:prevent-host-death family protein
MRSHRDLLHTLSKDSGMKKEVSITEAKARWSRLLRRVAAGEEITIANRGVPVARLVPVSTSKPKRKR